MALDLAIVIPTFNERENVAAVVAAVDRVLGGWRWEVIFVDDDSADGTFEEILRISRQDSRVRGIFRIGRRGLASACIEGMFATHAPIIAVMDADLQHDESLLPIMLSDLSRENLDLVVGSRYVSGGSASNWTGVRGYGSRVTTYIGQLFLRVNIADPMSGFFMLRREFLTRVSRRLSGIGFKILFDLIASARGDIRIKELPYHFRPRAAGTSKLDVLVVWEYFELLLDKAFGKLLPVRFLEFVFNGAVGLLLHLAILGLLHKALGFEFLLSQAVAALVAMTNNFFLNNLLTYRDRRFKGIFIIVGLFGFYLACGIGAIVNIQIAELLFRNAISWPVAGGAGALVGAVWNYAVTSTLLWRRR